MTKWCPQHGYPLPCYKCGAGEYELGKKAGIKEVVDWIDNNWFYSSKGDIYLHNDAWQVFKKRMGVMNGNNQ